MKNSIKRLILILAALATIAAVAQSFVLNKPMRRVFVRNYEVSSDILRGRLEDLWNLVDRPAKTNATMVRIDLIRNLATNGPVVTTNYTVRALDRITVKLVED